MGRKIGYKHSEEHKMKIRQIAKEKGFGKWMKDRHHSEEIKKKMSEAHKGKTSGMLNKRLSKETKRKMSEARKGEKHYNFGKHLSKETRKKISNKLKGEKSPNWRGGISFEPYSPAWTEELKQAIRQRDKFICQLCGEYPAFNVHHKDYGKKNCEPKNLITLCCSCHSKTNHNRNYWINYFNN